MNLHSSPQSRVFPNFQRSARLVFFLCICFATLPFPSIAAETFPAVVEAEVRAVISAEREGVLTRLPVGAGDRIASGGVLAEVFHQDLILQKELHEATREYHQIQVENLDRLNARGMVTDEELAKARMDLEVNQKEIRMVENQIRRSTIRAPFGGVVIRREVEPHEWVRPGQPVVELYDPKALRIVADIPAELAFRLKEGDAHRFFFPDLNRELSATLRVFTPQVDVRSNTVKVFWSVPTGQRELLPGTKGVWRIDAE